MARKSVLLLILLVLSARVIHAQDSSMEPPLIIQGNVAGSGNGQAYYQQFYRYADSSWELLPTSEISTGSVSPTGDYLAFLTAPPFMEELLSKQDWQTGTAWDIALLDLRDGSQRDIAIHTDPIQIAEDGSGYSGGIDRSVPVWSPDGRSFIWTEQDYPAQSSARLLIYDLDSGETRILDDALPFMNLSANGLPSVFSWDTNGIVVYSNDPADITETLRLYDAQTGLKQVVRLERQPDIPDYGFWYPFLGPLWLTDNTGEPPSAAVIAPAQANGRMYEINWITGEVVYVTPRLEMMSADNPETSLRLLWSFYHMFMDPPESLLQIVAADGTPLQSWDDFLGDDSPLALKNFVIAPSGQAAAYIQGEALYLWQDGAAQEIALPPDFRITGLQWGISIWRYATPYGPEAIG